MTELLIKWATKLEFINTLSFDSVDSEWTFESKQGQPYGAYVNDPDFSSGFMEIKKILSIDTTAKYKIKFELIENGGDFSGFVRLKLGDVNLDFQTQPGVFEQITNIPIGSQEIKIQAVGKLGIKNVSIEKITQDKIELIEDEKILLNLSVSDVKDFGNKKGTYSKTFKVPSTKNNDYLFSYLFEINNDSTFNVNKKISASITNDYINLVNGVIQLVSIGNLDGRVYYEIIFFDNTIDLFEKMGNKMLFDLDVSELNHTATRNNVQDSWEFPFTSNDYTYPLVNYGLGMGSWYGGKGYDTDGIGMVVGDLLPATGVKYLSNKIFNTYGYTIIDNDFTNGEKFNRLIMPFTNKMEKLESWVNRISLKRSFSSTLNDGGMMDNEMFDSAYWVPQYEYGPQQNMIARCNFTEVDYYGEVEEDNYYAATVKYFKCKRPGRYRVKCQHTVSNLYYEGQGGVLQYLCKLDAGTYDLTDLKLNVTQSETHLSSDLPISYDGNYHITYREVELEKGDAIMLKLLPKNSTTVFKSSAVVIEMDLLDFSRGGYLNGKNIVADDITQKEFINSLQNMFNLYIEPNEENSTELNILPREDYYNIGKVVDWTKKLDYQQEHTLQTTAELQSKKINFKYSDGDSYLHKEYEQTRAYDEILYGNKYIELDNDFSKGENNIEINFASSPLSRDWGTNGVGGNTPQFYFSHMLDEDYPANPVKYTHQTDWKPRILSYEKMDIGNNDGINREFRFEYISETDKKYPYAGHIFKPFNMGDSDSYDINFDTYKPYISSSNLTKKNLFNIYWRKNIEELISKDGRLLTAYFTLTIEDISNFKFNDKIFINGTYYTVNKIVDFDTSGENLTKVELFKTNPINITYEEVEEEEDYDNWFDDETNENPNVVIGNGHVVHGKPLKPHIIMGKDNKIGKDSESQIVVGDNIKVNPNSKRNFIQGENLSIKGDDNFIMNAKNSNINSDGNTIIGVNNLKITRISGSTISGITMIGSDSTTPTENGQVIIGNSIISNGEIVSAGGKLNRGGIDEVQNPNGISNIHLIRGGENCVDNIGKRRAVDIRRGGIDSV